MIEGTHGVFQEGRELLDCVAMEVLLPDGTRVLAQGRLDLVPSERPTKPDFALYLDDEWRGDRGVTWPNRIMDWEDGGLPADETVVFEAIVDLHRRAAAGELVEVACYGGIGRTGTVVGCLAVLAGLPSVQAVEWVRSKYQPEAVETPEQEHLIARFAQVVRRGDLEKPHTD